MMKDTYISDSVLYVGVDDKTIDLFESQYVVPNGVSYNSYVIMDDKIAIMDTVDPRKTTEWLANVEQALAGASRITWSSTTWSRITQAASSSWRRSILKCSSSPIPSCST